MAVRIFDTDPDSRPKPRRQFADDYAFRFRSGMQRSGKPISLSKWRVTTGDREVADVVAHHLGGKAEEWETSKEDYLEVLTSANAVQIVIDGPQAIRDRLILWGRNGPIHECDGVYFLSPEEDAGKECGCPSLLAERKAAARSSRGPAPHTSVTFRLAECYDLGLGTFSSTSWDFLPDLHNVRNELERIGGKVLCELSLELVKYTTEAGRNVEYRKPVIRDLTLV
ncbi:MAG: hypothetical protein JWL58_5032 [Streptosporangiaceae bacterium]|jgi:hypothetical protein|nr:hypothetical protein [Streptosporangiaceae bacterium]